LNSSDFLTNNVWKIAFSPCSQYLAIPKQDIYGVNRVVVIRCSNWHSNTSTDNDFCIQHQFNCTSGVWSLAFGQQKSEFNSITRSNSLDENSISETRFERNHRSHSNPSPVYRRHDFTKNLFLAAGLADGKINIWNIDTGELTLILKDHKSTVCGLDISCTMQLASCSHDTTVKLWDLLDDGRHSKQHILCICLFFSFIKLVE
jgi:WD40 repeat protein